MVKGAYEKLEGTSDPEVALQTTSKRGYVKTALVSVGVALLIAAAVGGAYVLKKHHRHRHHRHHHDKPEKVGAGFLF